MTLKKTTLILLLLLFNAMLQAEMQLIPLQNRLKTLQTPASSDILNDCRGALLWNGSYGDLGSQIITSVISLENGGYAFIGEKFTTDTDLWFGVVDEDGVLMWNKTFGSNHTDYGANVIETNDGFIIGGITDSFGVGYYDLWLLRTDSQGILTHNITIGTPASDIMEDMIQTSDGGFLILSQTIDISFTDRDFSLFKFDSEFNQLWNVSYDNSVSDAPFQVIEQADGTFVSVGWTETGGLDGWVIKTDANGNYISNKTFGLPGVTDAFYSVVEMEDGNLSLFGQTDGFGNGNLDFWLLQVDPNWNVLVNKTYGGTGSDIGDRIIRPRSGGLIAVGRTTSFGAGGVDGLLVGLDESGNLLWNHTYGGAGNDYIRFVGEAKKGGFIMAGWSQTYGPGASGGWLCLVPELRWLEQPGDFTIYENEPLNHEFKATSTATLTWTVNDTSRFTINQSGVLTYVSDLSVGTYNLIVNVTDSVGNAIWADFRLTIVESSTNSNKWLTIYLPIILAVLGGGILIGMCVFYLRRRKNR